LISFSLATLCLKMASIIDMLANLLPNGSPHARFLFPAVMYMNPFYMTVPQLPPANAAAYYYPQQQQQQQQVTVMYQQYPTRMEVGQDKTTTPPAATFQQAAAPRGAASTTTPPQVLHSPSPPAINNGARGPADQRVGRPSRDRDLETLQLFPLQPTFAQLRRDKGNAAAGSSASSLTSTAVAASASVVSEDAENLESAESNGGEAPALPFYDFFGLQSAAGR
jgi:hypothetical protein